MRFLKSFCKHLLLPTFALGLLAASGMSQPIAWSKEYTLQSNAKIARDNTGALYRVEHTPLFGGGNRLRFEKFTPLGALVWSRVRDEPGSLDNQFVLQDLVVTSSRIVLLHHTRAGAGTGPILASWVSLYDRENGDWLTGAGGINEEWYGMATNGQQIATLRKLSASDYRLRFSEVTDSGFNFINEFDLGSTEPRGEIRMDATNTVVGAIYKADTGHTRMIKATAVSGISMSYVFDFPGRTSEKPVRLEWDTTAQRAYALIDSVYSANDTDPLLFIWNTDTGASVSASTVRATSGFDYPGDLALIPGLGVYVSGFNPVLDQRTFYRRDVNGVIGWVQTQALATTDNTVLRHVVDSANNLVVSSESTNPSYMIDRYDQSTGLLISRFFVPLQGANPLQMLQDVAGNLYTNVESGAGSHFQRIQPAKLTFSANNVTGGTAVTATIQLASPATSDQVWTITSGNTTLVTAPATVTVTNGSSSVQVPLTVKAPATATNVGLNVRFAGFIEQQNLTLVPSVPQSISAMPQVVTGGTEIAGSVQLTGQAKAGGQTVTLTSNKPLVASVPASVNIPEGASSANFPITTYGVNANQGVVITATSGAVQKTVFIAVNAPALTSISVAPTTIKGGVTGILTLNISGPAPTGGFAIALISGAPGLVMLPAQSSVNAGNTSRNVSMPTAPVTATTSVLIFATRSGIYKTATLTVTP